MTDLQNFIALYKSFGIKCIVNVKIDSDTSISDIKNQHIYLSDMCFKNEQKHTNSDKFDGYVDFYSEVIFDEKGKFLSQGFWE